MHKSISYVPSKENQYLEHKLVEYRKTRPLKTSGNPYYVLGEPVGDLRDNMGCENYDLSKNVMTEERSIENIRVRLYQVDNDPDRPCIFFIHGGAFIGGSIEVVENPCKYLAEKSKSLVINIDYRLAPECAYPHNLKDCIHVIQSVLEDENILFNRNKVFISGDSAGANLALGCILELSQVFKAAMLYYPVVDLNCSKEYWSWNPEVYRGYPNEMVVHCSTSLKGSEVLMRKLYLQETKDYTSELISPIYIKEPNKLCPMLIQYAEYDTLRLQIEAFIKKFEKSVEIEGVCYQGLNHAFLDLFGIVDQAKNSVDLMSEYIDRKVSV